MRQSKCPYLPDLWARWDGELDEARAAAVGEHVVACPMCQAEQRELERLSAILQAGDTKVAMPPQKHERLKQMLLQACVSTLPRPHAPTPLRLGAWWASARRRFRSTPSAQRFAFAISIPLAVASVLLFLLLATETPAQTLERTLNAMAKVKSAHCVGWFIDYQSTKPNGQPISGRMRVEYWYKAPDKFRRNLLGPEVRGWGICPQQLIVDGRQAITLIPSHSTKTHTFSMMVFKQDWTKVTRDLSPFDFFGEEGYISQAKRAIGAQVTRREGTYNKRKVHVLTVQYPGGKETRYRWVLYIDPASGLILRSDYTWEWKKGSSWQPLHKETLERFDYNIEVKDELFRIPKSSTSSAKPKPSAKQGLRFTKPLRKERG